MRDVFQSSYDAHKSDTEFTLHNLGSDISAFGPAVLASVSASMRASASRRTAALSAAKTRASALPSVTGIAVNMDDLLGKDEDLFDGFK
jgi:hypothetical protein